MRMLVAPKAYMPTTLVTKSTAALQTMTAFDTVNLRQTVTVPARGFVTCRLNTTIHGATSAPSILMGIMQGATVMSAVSPRLTFAGTVAATSLIDCEAIIDVVGLTPGASVVLDAAYSVETLIAATAIKYGGPIDATANNAFGAFVFEVWGD